MRTLKLEIRESFILALMFGCIIQLNAQSAQYDFNSTATFLHPTIGDTALNKGVNAQSITNGFAGHGNIELELAGAPYKQSSIRMEWGYTNREGNADFFELDDMYIGMVGRVMTIRYATDDGGTVKVKQFTGISTGFVNGTNYAVTFSYDAPSGMAYLIRNIDTIWSTPSTGGTVTPSGSNIVAGSNLAWNSSTTSAFVGNGMDGSGNVNGTLDYFKMWSTAALPVYFLSIAADKVENGILVKWATASELNNEKFIIQRSYDGSNFRDIGIISGAGNSIQVLNYEFMDDLVNLATSIVYYRIQQVDYDGAYDYSEIVKVDVDTKKNSVSIYPNPITSGEGYIKGWNEGVTTKLYDQNGKLVKQTSEESLTLSDVKIGVYQVVFYNKNTQEYSAMKLMIQ